MDKLYELAHDQGIVIDDTCELKENVDAFYCWDPFGPFPPIIAISKKITNRAHIRTLIAHELGHHFTTVKTSKKKSILLYHEQLDNSRNEYRANVWAAEFLMPDDELESAMMDGAIQPWELAEIFVVDEELVRLRLDRLSKKWHRKGKAPEGAFGVS